MTEIAVTHEDRIVAAMTVGFVRRVHGSSCAFADSFEDGILRGAWDNHEMVQIPARHRIAQIERDAAIVQEIADQPASANDTGQAKARKMAGDLYAAAIREQLK